MNKINTFLAIFFTGIFAFGQNNLRKVIQKSDLIIEISPHNYRMDTLWANDFTYKTYLQIDKIDSTNAVIFRNKPSSAPKKLTLRKYTDNEDFYSDDINSECGCLSKGYEERKSYYELIFIRKEKNEYRILMHLHGLELEQKENYIHQVETIRDFENIKNEKERFVKTLDWFIENGLIPDRDFVEYYKTKGITTDTIQYSETQYQKALQQFKNGKEDLLSIVRDKYIKEIKLFYVQKLEYIKNQDKPNYYQFYKVFSNLTKNKLSIDDTDYILNGSLTDSYFSEYDKKRIMEHLIEVAKDWEN